MKRIGLLVLLVVLASGSHEYQSPACSMLNPASALLT